MLPFIASFDLWDALSPCGMRVGDFYNNSNKNTQIDFFSKQMLSRVTLGKSCQSFLLSFHVGLMHFINQSSLGIKHRLALLILKRGTCCNLTMRISQTWSCMLIEGVIHPPRVSGTKISCNVFTLSSQFIINSSFDVAVFKVHNFSPARLYSCELS